MTEWAHYGSKFRFEGYFPCRLFFCNVWTIFEFHIILWPNSPLPKSAASPPCLNATSHQCLYMAAWDSSSISISIGLLRIRCFWCFTWHKYTTIYRNKKSPPSTLLQVVSLVHILLADYSSGADIVTRCQCSPGFSFPLAQYRFLKPHADNTLSRTLNISSRLFMPLLLCWFLWLMNKEWNNKHLMFSNFCTAFSANVLSLIAKCLLPSLYPYRPP